MTFEVPCDKLVYTTFEIDTVNCSPTYYFFMIYYDNTKTKFKQ